MPTVKNLDQLKQDFQKRERALKELEARIRSKEKAESARIKSARSRRIESLLRSDPVFAKLVLDHLDKTATTDRERRALGFDSGQSKSPVKKPAKKTAARKAPRKRSAPSA